METFKIGDVFFGQLIENESDLQRVLQCNGTLEMLRSGVRYSSEDTVEHDCSECECETCEHDEDDLYIDECECHECHEFDGFTIADDVLGEVYYKNSMGELLGVRLAVTLGGPNIYIDTYRQEVEVFWGNGSVRGEFSRDIAGEIDAFYESIVDCL